VPHIQIFPAQTAYPSREAFAEALGQLRASGEYRLVGGNPIPELPAGSIVLFRYADEVVGEAIVREYRRMWGFLPYEKYLFLNLLTESGGGLEHKNSTVLMASRWTTRTRRTYNNWLNLASHEFFHAWNVERIRPAELEPFDFTKANPTPSLWLAEGFTQYYGPLLIRRAGQSTTDEFLTSLSGTLNGVVTGPGRLYGSPQEMSLRAPFVDAAAALAPTNPNIFTSYYPYGAIIGLALDLQLRGREKPLSLDDFMKRMWKTHGAPEKPYKPADIQAALAQTTGDAKRQSVGQRRSVDTGEGHTGVREAENGGDDKRHDF